MRTTIDIDEELLAKVMKITGLKSKSAAVNYALEEVVKRHQRLAILDLQGKVKWKGDLDEMRRD